MRREIYQKVKQRLSSCYVLPDGNYVLLEHGQSIPEGAQRMIPYINLWNHNVEFIEQEEAWSRPAVFIEFASIDWSGIDSDGYRTTSALRLHVVTDWSGDEDSLKVFDLCEQIREAIIGLNGDHFTGLKLLSTETNHNHEDLVESIEVFEYGGEWVP